MASPYVVTIFFPESTGSSFTTLAYESHIVGLGKALLWDIGHWDQNVFDVGSASLTSSFTTLAHSGGIKELSFAALAFSGTVSGHFASFTALSYVGTVQMASFTTLEFQSTVNSTRASFTSLETSGNVVFFQAASSFTATVQVTWGLTVPPSVPNRAEEKANEILARRLNRQRRKHDSFP